MTEAEKNKNFLAQWWVIARCANLEGWLSRVAEKKVFWQRSGSFRLLMVEPFVGKNASCAWEFCILDG